MRVLLIVLGGILAAVVFSLLMAYSLRRQNLHLQIEILRKVFHRSRSPWDKENKGWQQLGKAVENIPDDLRPSEGASPPAYEAHREIKEK